ncbi:MAG: guanylate kinase [Syntrophobacterales bacterium]|nr:guanylate kinase [Syntrophobacterales bacterium]
MTIVDGAEKKGRIFVVSGPSGVGKSSIIERFLKEDRDARFSISYTTRQKRPQEKEGEDYYFVDDETFREMTEQDRFLEWESVHDHYYGTPRKEVSEILKKGIDMILDIDVKGALKVKDKYPEACLVFIEPPSKEDLIRRLSLRGEKNLGIRMKRVEEELAKKQLFQYTIVNDILDRAYEDFKSIVETARRK